MRFSFSLPTCVEGLNQPASFAGPSDLIQLAQTAERLGFDTLWANDHITPWPGLRRAAGRPLNWYEALISTACCASVTEKIKLGLGVIVTPFREPVLLAKQVATLDVFSGGRILFGVGIGTVREEFEVLRPREATGNRGQMLDETLEVMGLLFSEPEASFRGEYYAFEKVSLDPKPLQKPLPLYVSGEVAATLERVAGYGTGLLAVGIAPEALRGRVDGLRVALEKVGRDISEVDVAVSLALRLDSTHERAVEQFRNSYVGRRFASVVGPAVMEHYIRGNLIGTPEEVAECIGEWAEAGMTHCLPQHIATETFEEMMEQMRMYAEQVVPLCGAL